MSGAERVTTGKSSGTAERQATERTEQSSAQDPELCIIRTPNYTLRGLALFVWRRPALHNQKRGRETLSSQSLSKQNPPLTCWNYVILPPSSSPPWPPLATPLPAALLPPLAQGLSSSTHTGTHYRTAVHRPSPRLRCRP